MGRRIDLTGQVFGEWIVLSWSHCNRTGGTYWNCVCSCGARKAVRGHHLRNKISTRCRSCASSTRREDLTGRVFGGWTVIGTGDYDGCGKLRWMCRCTCGKVSTVAGTRLVTEGSRRCVACANRLRATRK